MRSSYINWFYDNNKKLSEREELSHKMRHSVMTAQRNYLKVFDDDNDDNDTNNKEENIKIKNENEILKNKLLNCENQHKLTDIQYNKRRRDAIYKYNIKKVEPKNETLQKYNIKFDNTLNKYI